MVEQKENAADLGAGGGCVCMCVCVCVFRSILLDGLILFVFDVE